MAGLHSQWLPYTLPVYHTQVVRRDPSTSAATLLYNCSVDRGLTFANACALLHSLGQTSDPKAANPAAHAAGSTATPPDSAAQKEGSEQEAEGPAAPATSQPLPNGEALFADVFAKALEQNEDVQEKQ